MSTLIGTPAAETDDPSEEASVTELIASDEFELSIKRLEGRTIYDLTIWDNCSEDEASTAWDLIPDDAEKIDEFDYIDGRFGSVYIYKFTGTA